MNLRRPTAALLCACLLAASWPAEAASFRGSPGRLPGRALLFTLSQPLVAQSLKLRLAAFKGAPESLVPSLLAQAQTVPTSPISAARTESAKLLLQLLSRPEDISIRRTELAQVLGEPDLAVLEASALALTAPVRKTLEEALTSLSLDALYDGNEKKTAGLLVPGDTSRGLTRLARHSGGPEVSAQTAVDAVPAFAPIVEAGWAATRLRRLRAYAQALGFQFWWNVGPPLRHVWRSYRDKLALSAEPSVKDPRAFFRGLRFFGTTGRIGSSDAFAAADEVVLSEARALFARHIEAGAEARAAFERYLGRAVRYNPGKRRTKLRVTLAHHLREASALPASALAAYFDELAADDEILAAYRLRKDEIFGDFKKAAERVVLEANQGLPAGRRVLGVLVFGSFANGAIRPGSDIDLQFITEDGSAPTGRDLPAGLQRAWDEFPHKLKLEIISFTYVPPDPELLARIHREPILVVSPYAEVKRRLDRVQAVPLSEPASRVTLAGRLVRGMLSAWLRVLLSTTDLYDSLMKLSQAKDGASLLILDQLYAGAVEKQGDATPVVQGQVSHAGHVHLQPSVQKEKPKTQVLTRLEPNHSMKGVSGSFLVVSSRDRTLTAPESVALSAAVARAFPPGTLGDDSFTYVHVVNVLEPFPSVLKSVSGEVRYRSGKGVIVATDPKSGLRTVLIHEALLDGRGRPAFLDPSAFEAPDDKTPLSGAAVFDFKASFNGKLRRGQGSAFVGGLISVSAEPPEGFFAAATRTELEKSGIEAASSEKAGMWIYRTADSRPESYFKFLFPSPDRPKDIPLHAYADKFLIATGLGTTSDPASAGGDLADLLWLGDEQQGALSAYLKTLAASDKRVDLKELAKHKGFAQRLFDGAVFISGIDRTHRLTQEGFDALETDPKAYRRVFSHEYDQYLLSLFDYGTPSDKSYLLATSRGCSQGCAICASGGLAAFQYFSAPRMLRELEKIAQDAKLKPGEKANVFFLDSNFNNNPRRLIEFAALYDASPLKGRFNFFVRHNTVNGFLKAGAGGVKVPNAELIDAYAKLGIEQVFMGVDSYDDNSTRTLKTHKAKLADKGVAARPTYAYDEVRELVRAFERRGLRSRGFFLTNNPWVGDLDRIDGWYNLMELWLESPHFSVDVRTRDVIQLKPFPGSPITDVAAKMKKQVVRSGRFAADGALGELDEAMDFSELGKARSLGGAAAALKEFRRGLAKVRERAGRVFRGRRDSGSLVTRLLSRFGRILYTPKDRQDAELVIRKLLARDARLKAFLTREGYASPAADLLRDIDAFARAHGDLAPFDERAQTIAFAQASASLVNGLRELGGEHDRHLVGSLNFDVGYYEGLGALRPGAPHTIKDVDKYVLENLGQDVVDAKDLESVRFFIVEGDGREARRKLEADGWTLGEPVKKAVGFHQFYSATTPEGDTAYVVLHVNGRDRLTHMQSFFKLLGVPGERVYTLSGFRSWKAEYLAAFKGLGYVPDAVVYGLTWSAVSTVLSRDATLDAESAELKDFWKRFTRPKPEETPDNDIAMRPMKVVELEDGRRIWFFLDLYGKLGGDLMEALLEHGARNITALGTAGSLDPESRVGDFYTPAATLGADGEPVEVSALKPIPGVPLGSVHLHVATPNIETRAWLEESRTKGIRFVEVEFKYILEQFAKHPGASLHVAHAVSDVMVGPNRKDLTETQAGEIPNVTENVGKILEKTIGLPAGLKVVSVKTLPFGSPRRAGETPPLIGGLGFVKGYAREARALRPGAPHTLKDVPRYIVESLPPDVVAAKDRPEVKFFIVEGDGREARRKLEADGWVIGEPSPRAVGFRQFYRATTPEGAEAFVALHVNGRERIVHLQSTFKLMGVPAERVYTLPGYRSWKKEYLATFSALGYVPDAVVYGLPWTVVHAILKRDPSVDYEALRDFRRSFDPRPDGLPESDIAFRPMKVLELADGRRFWFFMHLYGTQAGDLVAALLEHGARDLTVLGSAGALNPESRVGDWFTPNALAGDGGQNIDLSFLKGLPGIPRDGAHIHVPTPSVETKEWLDEARTAGAKFVEVELKSILEQVSKFPSASLRAAYIVSDVLDGPDHKDLSETVIEDVPGMRETVDRIVGFALGLPPAGELKVESVRNVPFIGPEEKR